MAFAYYSLAGISSLPSTTISSNQEGAEGRFVAVSADISHVSVSFFILILITACHRGLKHEVRLEMVFRLLLVSVHVGIKDVNDL